MVRKQDQLSGSQNEQQVVASEKSLSAGEVPTGFLGYADLMVKLWSEKDFAKRPPTLIGTPEHEEVRVRCKLWLRDASKGVEAPLEGWWILTTPLVFYVYLEVFRLYRMGLIRETASGMGPCCVVEQASSADRFRLMKKFIELALRPALENADTVRLTSESTTEYEIFCSQNGASDIRKILMDPLLINFVERGVCTWLGCEQESATRRFAQLLTDSFNKEHGQAAATVSINANEGEPSRVIRPAASRAITNPAKQSELAHLTGGEDLHRAADNESD